MEQFGITKFSNQCIILLAWALYFLSSSFSMELPWIHCNNTWNTAFCWESMGNGTKALNESMKNSKYTPASEFFKYMIRDEFLTKTYNNCLFSRAVLEMQWSKGLHDMGYPKWQLVVCLLIIYLMLYISLFKGVKSSGNRIGAHNKLLEIKMMLWCRQSGLGNSNNAICCINNPVNKGINVARSPFRHLVLFAAGTFETSWNAGNILRKSRLFLLIKPKLRITDGVVTEMSVGIGPFSFSQ